MQSCEASARQAVGRSVYSLMSSFLLHNIMQIATQRLDSRLIIPLFIGLIVFSKMPLLGTNSQIIALTPMGAAYTQFLFVIRWEMGKDGRKRASPYPPVKG